MIDKRENIKDRRNINYFFMDNYFTNKYNQFIHFISLLINIYK